MNKNQEKFACIQCICGEVIERLQPLMYFFYGVKFADPKSDLAENYELLQKVLKEIEKANSLAQDGRYSN